VEPSLRVDLAFKRGGYIAELLQVRGADGVLRTVQDGDRVEKGQILARILDPDYRVKLSQAHGGLQQAEAALEQAGRIWSGPQSWWRTRPSRRTSWTGAQQVRARAAPWIWPRPTCTRRSWPWRTRSCAPHRRNGDEAPDRGGSLVGPGVGGFVLADMTRVKVVFGVPDSFVERFPLGTEVPAHVEAVDLDVHGRVTRVSPFADPKSRVFDVEVTMPNEDGRLKAGMTRWCPRRPMVTGRSRWSRWTRWCGPRARWRDTRWCGGGAGGVAQARVRPVHLGHVHGARIEIPDGLKAGERVVVSGAALVVDGESLAVIP